MVALDTEVDIDTTVSTMGVWVIAGYSGYTIESSIITNSIGCQMIMLTVWMVYV